MTDEMEWEPAASHIIEGSAFDVEAQLLREIEWRPPRGVQEPVISRRDAPGLLPQFNLETAASRLPIGMWDKILRYLADERETLGIAEQVCKGWYPTSHRLKQVRLIKGQRWGSMEDVHLYARYIKTIPRSRRRETRVFFQHSAAEEGKQRSRGNQRSLGHLGTFAAMFAGGLLPRLSWLCIEYGEWTPGAIQQSAFLHLSAFHSIAFLELRDITFPSISVLLRLVCAFDHMENLEIYRLRLLDRRMPPANRRWAPSPRLRYLTFSYLYWPDVVHTLGPTVRLKTSSGSETVQFLLNAVSCSDLNQLLRHAGKALYEFRVEPLKSLLGINPHSIQPLRVSDINMSRSVGLQKLTVFIYGDTPAALLERAGTYAVIQQMISSTCPTVLEQITINVQLNPSEASPSIISHVLLALRRSLCPPDHPLASEKYVSLESVELHCVLMDETFKRRMETEWANLAPIWFPSLYSRGIIKLAID